MRVIILALLLCAIGYTAAKFNLKEIAAHRARHLQRTATGSIDGQFGQSYCISKSNYLTSYKYIIPGRGTSFFLDFLGPSEDFCFQFDFPDTNPVADSTACLPESFFFLNFRVLNNANPTFNIVYRYAYNPASLEAREVPENSIRLLLFRDGAFGRFINDAQVDTNTKTITQGSSSLTDIRNNDNNFIGVYAGVGNCQPPSSGNSCGTGLQMCGSQCYSTAHYTCFDGILCPTGMHRCANACYNPEHYKCENDQLVQV